MAGSGKTAEKSSTTSIDRSTRTTSPVTGSCHQRHHNCFKPEAKTNSTDPVQWSFLRPTLEATVEEGIKPLMVKQEEAKWGLVSLPRRWGVDPKSPTLRCFA